MSEMSYTTLGQSGLVVSRLALGTMTFTLGSEFIPGIAAVGQDEASEMVAAALDAGVNFFDSANGYSSGDAEKILGTALKGRRQEAVICTKIGFRQGPGIGNAGLSRGHIFDQVDGCLARLETDFIDLLIVHKTDFTTPMEETLRALDDVVKSGKVRYIGVSNWPAWQVARAVQFQKDNGLVPFVAGQYLYNAVARDIEIDVLPMSDAMGLGLMAWSPLAGGLLTGKYDLKDRAATAGRLAEFDFLETNMDQAAVALEAIQSAANAHDATPVQIAQAWILAKKRNHTVIIGANKRSQLDASLAAAAISLSEDDVAAIDAAAAPGRRYPEWFDNMMHDEVHKGALG